MSTESKKSALLRQARAIRDTMQVVHGTDVGSMNRFGSYKTFMRKYNQLVDQLLMLLPNEAQILDYYNLEKAGTAFNTIGLHQKDMFEGVLANVSLMIALLENDLGVPESELGSLGDFLAARTRAAIFDTPETEREVQQVVEQLLIGRGLQRGTDYDRERGRVTYSAKELIPDFIFPPLHAALEIKLVTTPKRRSEVVDEINADILAYSPKYPNLLFLVYDLGIVRDDLQFRKDIEAHAGVRVLLVKH